MYTETELSAIIQEYCRLNPETELSAIIKDSRLNPLRGCFAIRVSKQEGYFRLCCSEKDPLHGDQTAGDYDTQLAHPKNPKGEDLQVCKDNEKLKCGIICGFPYFVPAFLKIEFYTPASEKYFDRKRDDNRNKNPLTLGDVVKVRSETGQWRHNGKIVKVYEGAFDIKFVEDNTTEKKVHSDRVRHFGILDSAHIPYKK
jgi:hypothetical protein